MLSTKCSDWKKPVPVPVTQTVNVTVPPDGGTAVGLAVLLTLMEYVGAAAMAVDAAIDRSPTAAKTAATLVRLFMPSLFPLAMSRMARSMSAAAAGARTRLTQG
jgi:hypothetical protein